MSPLFFIFDLDETLLTSDKILTESTVEAINLLREAGHRVTLASGRAFDLMKPYAIKLNIKEPMVANNGGSIQDLKGNVYYEAFVEKEAQRAVLKHALKHNYPVVQYTQEGFSGNESERMAFYRDWNKTFKDHTLNTHITSDLETLMQMRAYKLLTVVTDEQDFKALHDEYASALPAHVTKSQDTFLDVLPLNTNKGTGVIKLIDMLNIEAAQVVVFGDNDNDKEMLNLFANSYAMKNGSALAKEAARFITLEDNNNDGVAKTLRHALNR